MNSFVNAVKTVPVLKRTENGMKAQTSTMSAVVDLFYKIGGSRGMQIVPQFEKAYQDNPDLALRVAQWARDVRGGAGERQLFRDILTHLEFHHTDVLLTTSILRNVAEIGRWDDLLIFSHPNVKSKAFGLIEEALKIGNGLCAKWMPRKGSVAAELRVYLELSPKAYRKLVVGLSNTVEQKLCAREFEKINYSHVPSLAMSRYMKAFSKNDAERFVAYRNALKAGDKTVKVNASAVYPYDVIKSLKGGDKDVADAMWKALPDYMDESNVLPMVDVSGSMGCSVGGNANLQCIDVALSLGLYCADKNKGAFKDMFLTFSDHPELLVLKGTLSQKMVQMNMSHWEMNTNLHAAFELVLETAIKGKASAEDMPSILLVLSDMQFDQCARFDDSAMQMISRKYEKAGYKLPTIIFWNLNDRAGNTPVSFNQKGVGLVSGFSPSIMKAILSSDMDTLSPETIVRDAVMIDRYNYV